MEHLPWYISCCWSLANKSVGRKEGLTWHLEVEAFVVMGLGYLIWFDFIRRFFLGFSLGGVLQWPRAISYVLLFLWYLCSCYGNCLMEESEDLFRSPYISTITCYVSKIVTFIALWSKLIITFVVANRSFDSIACKLTSRTLIRTFLAINILIIGPTISCLTPKISTWKTIAKEYSYVPKWITFSWRSFEIVQPWKRISLLVILIIVAC